MLLSELSSADRVKVLLGGRTKDDLHRELVEPAVPSRDGDARVAVVAGISRLLRRKLALGELRAARCADEFLDAVRASEAA